MNASTTSLLAVGLMCLSSALASLAFTWLVRRWAPKFGLVDKPDGHRKLHSRVTPLGGGIAVFMAMAFVMTAYVALQVNSFDLGWDWWRNVLSLALASTVIVVVGVLDDRFRLRGRQKLFGQILAAMVLAGVGGAIEKLEFFGYRLELGPTGGFVFTVFWLVGAINAINLLDGIDGLATSVGVLLSITIGVLAAIGHHHQAAVTAFVFAGALLGFLRFNIPPATIFLGDAGSMLIGLMVGALSMHSSLKSTGTLLLTAPLAICAIPILDSAAAILRRKLTGRSIYATDRAHLHHRLTHLLGGTSRTLLFIVACCAITSAAAIGSVMANNDFVALLTCVGLVTVLVAARIFGHAELALLSSHAVRLGRSLAAPVRKSNSSIAATVRLQGNRNWEIVWETLVEWAEKLKLCEISLDINLAVAQEGYHATWKSADPHDAELTWRLQLPLTVERARIGMLKLAGRCSEDSLQPDLEQLDDLLEPFAIDVMKLIQGKKRVEPNEEVLVAAEASAAASIDDSSEQFWAADRQGEEVGFGPVPPMPNAVATR